jgi:1,4-alpha-glucan branching enzyme
VTVKHKKDWEEIFNSDAKKYWGAGDVYNPKLLVEVIDKDEKIYRLRLNLPPLGGIVLR